MSGGGAEGRRRGKADNRRRGVEDEGEVRRRGGDEEMR